MVTYVEAANEALRAQLLAQESVVVMGQNVDAGSRLAGLATSFSTLPSATIINSTNSENSLVGCGFGMMLRQQPSLLLLKQEDFLLLGVDQLVNTWNLVRSSGSFVPFVIGVIVVDSGWEGAQSGFNNTCGIASLARIPWYTPSGGRELRLATEAAFGGGPRLIAYSQRLFRHELGIALGDSHRDGPGHVSYDFPVGPTPLAHVLILSLNFSLPYCTSLAEDWQGQRHWAVTVVSFFEGPIVLDESLDEVICDADLVVVVSDEKSEGLTGADHVHQLVQMKRQGSTERVIICKRTDPALWSVPSSDRLDLSALNEIVI